MKRIKTTYPGVFYREAERIGAKGLERVYYVVFKKNRKTHEEKAGRQYADNMTAAKAARYRGERIEGKRLSRKEKRQEEQVLKEAAANKWTIDRLWEAYKTTLLNDSSRAIDEGRYNKYLKDSFGHKEPRELILLEIDRLRLKTSKKLSPQSVKHILMLLDRVINFAVKRGLCSALPFQIKKPRVDNIKTEDLSSSELTTLFDAIEQDDNIHAANMMKLALFTGMRRGELFKLKWEDIDFHRGFISIRDPKGGPDQKIPLNDAARNLLQKHIKTESEFIFPGRGGNRRVTINEAVNRIKKRAGLPKSFRPLHGLRHVFASMLASSGQVDLYVLQKLLTHKDARMTQRYAHLRDDVLKRASSVMVDLLKTEVKNGEEAKRERQ